MMAMDELSGKRGLVWTKRLTHNANRCNLILWGYQMSAHRKNYDYAVVMYEAGLSIQQDAWFYSVTRQAMYAILKRRGVLFRPHIRRAEENHFYRGGVTKDTRAHQIYTLAIEKGIIVRNELCEACGSTGRIEGHHDSYDEPLSVRWLCHNCHHDWHKNNIAAQATNLHPRMERCEIARLGGKSAWATISQEQRKEKMADLRAMRKK